MSMSNVPVFTQKHRGQNHLEFVCAEGHVAHVFVLEADIVRVMLLPAGQLNFPRTWAIAPGQEDVVREGRDRFDLTGFGLPAFALTQNAETVCIDTGAIRLTIQLKGFFCQWETQVDGVWQFAAQDRYTQSYNFGCGMRRSITTSSARPTSCTSAWASGQGKPTAWGRATACAT